MEKIMLDPALRKLLHANKLYLGKEVEWETKFNRINALDLYNKLDGSKEYIFFTKPDLNLFKNNGHELTADAARNTILYDIHKRYPKMLKQLQLSASSGPFMNVLTNSVKNTVDLPTITSKVAETSSTVFGSRLYYRRHSFESDEGHEVTLEFEDTRYLELYAMFKAWDEYTRMKAVGLIKPKDEYIKDDILDDQISIYKIIVSLDGSTILFYAKLTGCFPTAVPREAFSELDDRLIYNIPFKTTWVEDSDPIIIKEFNKIVGKVSGPDIRIYNKQAGHINAEWVTTPYIAEVDGKYKLKWK